jgi:hypothetical protein
MPFCSSCGTQTDGAFCSNCGAKNASAPESAISQHTTETLTQANISPPPRVSRRPHINPPAALLKLRTWTLVYLGLVWPCLFSAALFQLGPGKGFTGTDIAGAIAVYVVIMWFVLGIVMLLWSSTAKGSWRARRWLWRLSLIICLTSFLSMQSIGGFLSVIAGWSWLGFVSKQLDGAAMKQFVGDFRAARSVKPRQLLEEVPHAQTASA